MIFAQKINNYRHKWLLLVIGIVVVLGSMHAIFVIPEMQGILKKEREGAALNSLREIYRAEASFYSTKGRFATLKELADEGLIKKEYANSKGIKGYNFSDSEVTAKTFTVHADREASSSGFRDFNILETGDIYYIESHDRKGTVPRGQGTEIGSVSD